MSYIVETFTAGETKRLTIPGRFFLIMAAASAVDVSFFSNRQRLNETVKNVGTGFSFQARDSFDEVELTSAAAQTVTVLISDGRVEFASAVNVTNLPASNGAFTNSRATVLTSGVSTLLAANANRRAVLVQNNSLADAIRLTMDGVDPTAAQGIRIAAGGFWEAPAGYAPTGAIKAIAETGAGCAVEVVEG